MTFAINDGSPNIVGVDLSISDPTGLAFQVHRAHATSEDLNTMLAHS